MRKNGRRKNRRRLGLVLALLSITNSQVWSQRLIVCAQECIIEEMDVPAQEMVNEIVTVPDNTDSIETIEPIMDNTGTEIASVLPETEPAEVIEMTSRQKIEQIIVTNWQWSDSEKVYNLSRDQESGSWRIGLLGADVNNQTDFASIVALLPTTIVATIKDSGQLVELGITWNSDTYVQDIYGNWPVVGSYDFYAVLPESYTLESGAETMRVIAEVGNTREDLIQEVPMMLAAEEATETMEETEATAKDATVTEAETTMVDVASPPETSVITFDYKQETITFAEEYEVNTSKDFNGKAIAAGDSIAEYIADTGNESVQQVLYVRAKATSDDTLPSAAVELMIPTRPQIPIAEAVVTANSITLTSNEAWEYSEDGSVWIDANEFTQLGECQEKTYYVRTKATDTTFASEVQTVTATTNQASYTVSIPTIVNVPISDTSVQVGIISLSQENFDLGYQGKVVVSVAGGTDAQGYMTLSRIGDEDTKITSLLIAGDTPCGIGTDVVTYTNLETVSTIPVTMGIPRYDGVIPAGEYTTTVTFDVRYVEETEETEETGGIDQ